ncbi:maleylpyruvate isomerase family mycothiol-dependent enzyme [Actinoplanes sp. NPDC024001]|uniref:maleylpyruvate isomerase family mycothiol-dependent enzyme n=1 Tax=Actinoplanes sp. NPDC024001 TaxID=3154598 RepID=UPI0033F3AFDC
MEPQECWTAIAGQRRAVAELLAGLATAEWETPSLCAGWRVRDVAAHLAMTPLPPGPLIMAAEAIRAGGRFHRFNHVMAVRHAQRPTTELVAELREHAGSRRLPAVTTVSNALFDVLVHSQDIAVPLGRRLPMPTRAAAAGATRVWTMGWPFWARRRFRGVRLTATDTDWSVGAGPEITGPIEALLLLLTGRAAALPRLTGAGLAHRSATATE